MVYLPTFGWSLWFSCRVNIPVPRIPMGQEMVMWVGLCRATRPRPAMMKHRGHYCWWFRNPGKPVEVGSLSHFVYGFIDPRWCRISSINSSGTWHFLHQFRSFPSSRCWWSIVSLSWCFASTWFEMFETMNKAFVVGCFNGCFWFP